MQDQHPQELGIPGVRMYLQDGTSITTDVEGKYSVCDLDPKLNVLVLDQTTLPRGSVMTTSGSRNVGDAMSVFLDLKNGDMQRADFVETGCYDGVVQQVKARQGRDDAKAPVIKAGEENTYKTRVLDFESKPVNVVLPAVAR
jgi:L-asparaginase/Glu-tRNA(Gln) amidotransferase subunit D